MARYSEINTERLRLRPLVADDAEAITNLIADWDVVRMLARAPWPYGISDARHYLARAADWPWEFAITGPQLMGVVSMTGHLGYWIGKPYWGRGFMTEAATAIVDAYFAGTTSKQIASGVFDGNEASLRVLAKLGFVEAGRSRQMCRSRNAEVDHIDMVLLRSAWKTKRAA